MTGSYNYDHYTRVQQARKLDPKKYPDVSHRIWLTDHPLIGKLIFCIQENGVRRTDLASGKFLYERNARLGNVHVVEKVWAEFSMFYWSVHCLMHNSNYSSSIPTLGMWHKGREVNQDHEMPSWTPDYVRRDTRSFRGESWILDGLEGFGDFSSEPSTFTRVCDFY